MSTAADSGGLPGFHVLRPEPRIERASRPTSAIDIVHRGGGRRPEVALTFDDGPSQWSAEISEAFERRECLATFFMQGTAVEQRPEVVAALAAAGHEIGNHLLTHSHASKLSQAQLRVEIEHTADALEATGAPRPHLIRPPYFGAPHAVAKAATGTGATAVILRSIGSSDWEATSADQIVKPMLTHIRAGDIVCLHDGISSDQREGDSRRPTADAVAMLVPTLLEQGLRPVTVSQLLR